MKLTGKSKINADSIVVEDSVKAGGSVDAPTVNERPDILIGARDNLIDVWFSGDKYSDVGAPSGNTIELSNGNALTGVIGNTIVFPYDLDGYTLVYKGSGTLTKSGDTLTWSADGTIWDITLTSSLHVIDIACLEGSGAAVCDRSGNHFHGYFSAGTWGNQTITYGSLDNRNQSEGFYRI